MSCRTALALLAFAGIGIRSAAGAASDPVEHLLTLAATHQEQTVRRGAVNGLIGLKWQPTTDAHWEKLSAVGATAFPLLDTLLTSAQPNVRARTLGVLSKIGSTDAQVRADAVDRIVKTGMGDAVAEVQATAAACLLKLKWPASDAEADRVVGATPPLWPFIDALIAQPAGDHTPRLLAAVKKLAGQPATQEKALVRVKRLGEATPPQAHKPPPKKPEPPPKKPEPPPKKPEPVPKKPEPGEALTTVVLSAGWRPTAPDDWAKLVTLGPRALPVIDRLLRDKEPEVRMGALHTLGNLATKHQTARSDVMERLVRLACEPKADEATRLAATMGVLKLNGPASDTERAHFARAGEAALPLVDKLIGNPSIDLRTRGVACLLAMGKQSPGLRAPAVERLLLIGHGEKDVALRAEAVKALVGLGWPASDAELQKAMAGTGKAGSLVGELFAAADEAMVARLSEAILRMAEGDEAARTQALELLPQVAAKSRLPAARRRAFDIVMNFTESSEPAWAAQATLALARLAKSERSMRQDTIARLLKIVAARKGGPVQDAALLGLGELQWRPVTQAERDTLVALGPSALFLADGLLRDPDAATRTTAVKIVSDVARRDKDARDEAIDRLFRAARDDKDPKVAALATQSLRELGWPQSDDEWADLVALGEPATRLLHVMVADKDEDVRGRAVTALAHVGAAHGAAHDYAVKRLAQLARAERNPHVRGAVMSGLARLRWPETQEEWRSLDSMGCGALSLLACLVHKGKAEIRDRAVEEARRLVPRLVAMAERAVDNLALLDGLELEWHLSCLDRRTQILELCQKNQLEQASALFREGLTRCEETEKKIHTLVVQAGTRPLGGVANKWRTLGECLAHRSLARLRNAWPLSISNWQATLKKRAAEADKWDAAHDKVTAAPTPKAKLAVLDQYLKGNSESFYAQFAWKWKDLVARNVRSTK